MFCSAADIYVNNSGQAGTYTTITAALAAAAPNDNVYVSPYDSYTENLTIFQNVTLASAVSGTVFNVVGTLTINGAPNMNVRIIGAEFSGNLNATTGGAGLNTKSDVYVVESSFSSISASNFIQMHVLFCSFSVPMNLSIRHGKVIGNNNIGNITIMDGPNAGVGDTVFIVGNVLGELKYIRWRNDDNYFYIANNTRVDEDYYCLEIDNHHYNSLINNLVINNTFSTNGYTSSYYDVPVRITSSSNRNNIQFFNNILEHKYPSSTPYAQAIYANSSGSGSVQLFYNYIKGYQTGVSLVVGNKIFYSDQTNLNILGNGICNDPLCVNQGSPSLQFYDIDLTRNDIGTFGGPNSIKNYLSDSTSLGKARVYDLDMPFEIWSGQTPTVKAKGTHTK